MAIPPELTSHREALRQAFGNQSEDLEANHAGRLGLAQGRRLLRSGTANLGGAFLIGVLLAAILYGVAAKPLAPIQWILGIILFVVVLMVGIRYFLQTRAAVAEGRVESLVGPVHIHSRGRAGWYLNVGGQSFHLPIRPWHIQQGAPYQVYFVHQTRTIVAIEPYLNP